jgi:hypothetical protein
MKICFSDAPAAVATDSGKAVLWLMAADGLGKAAEAERTTSRLSI